MGTALVRTDPKGRNYQTLLHEDLFAPLRMDSTSMGLRPDLAPRHVKPDMRGRCRSSTLSRNLPGDHALFEDPDVEAPHVGCASTSGDLYRFAEMLAAAASSTGRGSFARDARARAAGPHRRHAQRALQARRRERRLGSPAGQPGDRLPGARHRRVPPPVRHARQPETHGNYGAGSTMFWVDPARDVSFALCSAGVMTQAANIERCQKLSDLALSAMI
jgi:CubicO group peptidase (beta-lactamase class C family)